MKTTTTNSTPPTFALIGAAGYAAPKHLAAIKELGGKVMAVSDPNDNLEVLDRFFPDCEYFKSTFELEKFLKEHPVDYGVICSPSFLHTDHIEMMVQSGCDVICESPLVITTKEYERVQKAENKTGKKVYNILQYRYHPAIVNLKESFKPDKHYNIELINHTYRGKWFEQSWKGKPLQSGGILTSLGYHFFDFLIWIYGEPISMEIIHQTDFEAKGKILLQHATVSFSLSNISDKNKENIQRELKINGQVIDLNKPHPVAFKQCYAEILNNRGIGANNIKEVIDLLATKNT